jgi:hypothetical protein
MRHHGDLIAKLRRTCWPMDGWRYRNPVEVHARHVVDQESSCGFGILARRSARQAALKIILFQMRVSEQFLRTVDDWRRGHSYALSAVS